MNYNVDKKRDIFLTVLMFAMMGVALITFFGTYGTGDTLLFTIWIQHALDEGIVGGFAANQEVYPPLIPLMLTVIHKAINHFIIGGGENAIRVLTTVFSLSSCILAKLMLKDNRICILLFLSTFLSVTDRYLDIVMVPFIIASYFFAKNRKYVAVGASLALMCLMKYQPLIMMPVVLTALINIDVKAEKGKRFTICWKPLLKMALGGIVPVAVVALVYRGAFFRSIYLALFGYSELVAPQGLNVGWIVQFIYEKLTGTYYEKIEVLRSIPNIGLVIYKYLFVIGYLAVFARLIFLRGKKISDILKGCIIVFILYYLFNVNVHENHLFVGMILALLLYAETKELPDLIVFAIVAFIHNVNLGVFNGIFGSAYPIFNRIIFGVFDPTLIVAIVNVIIGTAMTVELYLSFNRKNNKIPGGTVNMLAGNGIRS